MTKQETIKLIHALCVNPTDIHTIQKQLQYAITTVRRYVKVLVNRGLLHKSFKKEKVHGKPCPIFKSKNELTEQILLRCVQDIRMIRHERNRKYFVTGFERIKAPVKEEVAKSEEVVAQEIKQGIYKLSSHPSKEFVKKFKAQSEQTRKERKSPKNYPGTSAGMVW